MRFFESKILVISQRTLKKELTTQTQALTIIGHNSKTNPHSHQKYIRSQQPKCRLSTHKKKRTPKYTTMRTQTTQGKEPNQYQCEDLYDYTPDLTILRQLQRETKVSREDLKRLQGTQQ